MLTHTPRLGESHTTRVTKRLTQPKISAVNLDESSSIPNVKGMDPDGASSTDIHLPPEEGINQVVDSAKVRNYRSCKYLTEFMLDVIRNSGGGTEEILTTLKVASRKLVRQRQEKGHLTDS